jgi:hypothetical protein
VSECIQMDELVGRKDSHNGQYLSLTQSQQFEDLEILRHSNGASYSVIKISSKFISSRGAKMADCYFKVYKNVKRITDTEYWSLKDEDKEFWRVFRVHAELPFDYDVFCH